MCSEYDRTVTSRFCVVIRGGRLRLERGKFSVHYQAQITKYVVVAFFCGGKYLIEPKKKYARSLYQAAEKLFDFISINLMYDRRTSDATA